VNYLSVLLIDLAQMDMAIGLMVIDTQYMLAVRKFAFSSFKRSPDFFHNTLLIL